MCRMRPASQHGVETDADEGPRNERAHDRESRRSANQADHHTRVRDHPHGAERCPSHIRDRLRMPFPAFDLRQRGRQHRREREEQSADLRAGHVRDDRGDHNTTAATNHATVATNEPVMLPSRSTARPPTVHHTTNPTAPAIMPSERFNAMSAPLVSSVTSRLAVAIVGALDVRPARLRGRITSPSNAGTTTSDPPTTPLSRMVRISMSAVRFQHRCTGIISDGFSGGVAPTGSGVSRRPR